MMSRLAICIGCGCDDFHACYDPDTESGCYWLRVDYERGIGVCSACDDFNLEAWDMGDFTVRSEPIEPVPSAYEIPRSAHEIRSQCCHADPGVDHGTALAEIRQRAAEAMGVGVSEVEIKHVSWTPAPCDHEWNNGGNDPTHCQKCGMSFMRHIFMECP